MQVCWVLWLRVSHKAAIKVSARPAAISRLSLGRDFHFQAHSYGCCRIQLLTKLLLCRPHFLVSCWPEAALVLCHMGLSIGQHTTWQLASLGQAREIESVRAKQKSVFCNLILEVTSHNSYKLHSRDNLLGTGDRW